MLRLSPVEIFAAFGSRSTIGWLGFEHALMHCDPDQRRHHALRGGLDIVRLVGPALAPVTLLDQLTAVHDEQGFDPGHGRDALDSGVERTPVHRALGGGHRFHWCGHAARVTRLAHQQCDAG